MTDKPIIKKPREIKNQDDRRELADSRQAKKALKEQQARERKERGETEH